MTDQFLGVSARRGAVVRERVMVGKLGDGTPISLPVIIIAGQQTGPILYLQSGLHGDEITGVEVLHGILTRVDPSEVRGTIVAVPCANPAAFITRTRGFALEERGPIDVNRIFPGSPRGLLSERIAHLLLNEFVLKADYAVDFHSALAGCNMYPFVYVDPDDDEGGTLEMRERMARALRTELVYYKKRGSKLGTSVMSGSLRTQAERHGKASVTLEMGESGRITWPYVPPSVEGGLNLLRELGMIPGEPDPPREQTRFSTIDLVHSEEAGLFHPKVEAGQRVRQGQVLAEVVDVFTHEATTVVAPNDGIVLRIMLTSPVMVGAELFWLVR